MAWARKVEVSVGQEERRYLQIPGASCGTTGTARKELGREWERLTMEGVRVETRAVSRKKITRRYWDCAFVAVVDAEGCKVVSKSCQTGRRA